MQLPDLSLLLAVAIFWATYWVLRVTVFQPLGRILEEREKTTQSAAQALEAALEKQRAAMTEIDDRLTQARREALALHEAKRQEAAAVRQARLDEAREKARTAVAEAQTKLEGEIAAARAELEKGAAGLAAELASTALGRRVA